MGQPWPYHDAAAIYINCILSKRVIACAQISMPGFPEIWHLQIYSCYLHLVRVHKVFLVSKSDAFLDSPFYRYHILNVPFLINPNYNT